LVPEEDFLCTTNLSQVTQVVVPIARGQPLRSVEELNLQNSFVVDTEKVDPI
jgi:hypothetical protein